MREGGRVGGREEGGREGCVPIKDTSIPHILIIICKLVANC